MLSLSIDVPNSKVQRSVHLLDDAIQRLVAHQDDHPRVETGAHKANCLSLVALLAKRVADVDATAGNQIWVADCQRQAQLV